MKSPSPGFPGGLSLRARQEVLQGHVEEGRPRLGKDLGVLPDGAVDVDAPSAALVHPSGDGELVVDEHRPAIADEDPRRHDRKAVPSPQESAGLVEGCPDEAAMGDSRCRLVPIAEGKGRLVAIDPFLRGNR